VEAKIVAHLAEVDARQLYLSAGMSSLFQYCRSRLNLSENESFYRITAARLARKYPAIVPLLDCRQLSLSSIAVLRDYLTPSNHSELLEKAQGKSKRELLELLARTPVFRAHGNTSGRLPRAAVSRTPGGAHGARAIRPNSVRKLASTIRTVSVGPTATLEPLPDANYRLVLNASHTLVEKLELARDLMSHVNPHGAIDLVIERALETLIAELKKRRFGERKQPQLPRAPTLDSAQISADPNHTAPDARAPAQKAAFEPGASQDGGKRQRGRIPSDIRRAIVARDGLCCTFTSRDGERCGARALLQLHHEVPWAVGGADTLDNLRLLCARHNRWLARRQLAARPRH
jgi:hypothetical protein